MGVKLDWDIEAEKGKRNEHREDPQLRSKRYAGVFRLLLVVAVFAGILGGIVGLIYLRWQQVTQYSEQLLADTVQAEVAALRVGDNAAYEELQRSATNDWGVTQNEVFNNYQSLKVESNIVLSGRVIDNTVDGQRGRVQVEEIIDGVPYVQTWFYWRYEDGWRHVPPDYTFWGDSQTIESNRYIIRYRDLDTLVAIQVETELDRWFADTCAVFDCSNIPLLTIDILPAPGSPVRWADNEQNAWQMVLPSPYTGRTRADMSFDTQLQIDTATLLATRIVNHQLSTTELQPASDATFLKDSTIAWLVGRFVQLNPETYFIQSLVDNYGQDTLSRMLQNLQPVSSINLVASITQTPTVDALNVDWRDYVLWRLNLEDQLILAKNESTWAALYDFANPSVRDSAYLRYNNDFTASSRTVNSATIVTDSATPQLIARVNVTRGFESGEEIIVFNLINGNWLRGN